MEEIDQILIERYLAGELTEAERHDVERRRAEDPSFHQEIIDYEEAVLALRQKQREELRQRFARRDEILDKKKPEPARPDKNRFLWIWVAASLIATLVIWRFLFTNDQPAVPVEVDASDSTQTSQPPVVRMDSVLQKDSLSYQQSTEKPKMSKPDMADNTKKGQELFAAYFEPYKDAMMDPTTRGDDDMSPLQKYQKAYWDGEYQKAMELFSQLSKDYQGNDNYRFSYANALLETGKTDQAISILESIIQNNRSRYVAEAYFGVAMCHLRKGNKTEANDWLVKYVKLEKAANKGKANDIMLKLKE
ncbi:MAG: tetratricopeptide repeat protein [Saprospiraceae bacterium]|nr:tetratricopeptide repeat protein [Saprospiraceae bacterium]